MDSLFCLIYFIVIHATFLSSAIRINTYNANDDNGNVTNVHIYLSFLLCINVLTHFSGDHIWRGDLAEVGGGRAPHGGWLAAPDLV